MKREIVLKEGAPPIEKLHAVLRIDMPYQFNPKNYANWDGVKLLIGRPVENLLDAVNEEALMLEHGVSNVVEMIDGAYGRFDETDDSALKTEWVLVDDDNVIWSELIETVDSSDL